MVVISLFACFETESHYIVLELVCQAGLAIRDMSTQYWDGKHVSLHSVHYRFVILMDNWEL